MRNVFRDLGDLPDKARVGVNLIVAGLGILVVRYTWPLVGLASFQRASTIVFNADIVLRRYSLIYRASPDALSDYLIACALLCLVSGSFIFLRRVFWWIAERRSEGSITEIDLK